MAITESSAQSQLKLAVAMLDNLFSTQTAPADEAAIVAATEGPLSKLKLAAASVVRSRVAQAVASAQLLMSASIVDYSTEITLKPDTDPIRCLGHLYDHFITNSVTILSRNITYGTWTTFGSSKGELSRLTVDENGFRLEATYLEKRTLKCVRTGGSGARRFAEIFSLEGSAKGTDILNVLGSGAGLTITVASALNSRLLNSAFSQYSFATAPVTSTPSTGVANDELTNWVVDDITALQLDVDTIAQSLPGVTTPTVIRFAADNAIRQKLSVSNMTVNLNSPDITGIWLQRLFSCDGDLTINQGNTSKTIDVTTLSAGWNWVELDKDAGLWPKTWLGTDSEISFVFANRTTGTLALSNPYHGPMNVFDGLWYFLPAGTTPHALDDSITATSSVSSDSKIQRQLVYGFGLYLPSVKTSTEITAAGGRTFTFSGQTLTLSTGDLDSDDFEVGQTLTIAGTSNNNGTKVITAVTATVITVAGSAFTSEGPLSSTATIQGAPSISDPS